jgi:hypothetical protein
MWLLAQGQVALATGLFVAAKVASTALVARIFTLTHPALMRIVWFARIYNCFMPWKHAFFATIRASRPWRYGRMVKIRIRLRMKLAWARWRPAVLALAKRAIAMGRTAMQRLSALYEGGRAG